MIESSINNIEIYDNILISICLCTYCRNDLLGKCLSSLLYLNFVEHYEIIVVDNDSSESARFLSEGLKDIFQSKGIPFLYSVEVCQGIASARNHAVSLAKGKYIAFIDDDEVADSQWLTQLYRTMLEFKADGVWGPVLPVFPENFPEWQKHFFSRPRIQTGTQMTARTKGTGNVLITRSCLEARLGPFDVALNRIGGSDSDLFNWLECEKKVFVWCNNAVVYEYQPIARSKLRWHIIRCYRGGWGVSRLMAKRKGFFNSFIIIFIYSIPSLCKNIALSFRKFNLYSITYGIVRSLSAQSGKFGFFLNIKIKEY
jgi:succinoglycan biosynthesis protein ExoM